MASVEDPRRSIPAVETVRADARLQRFASRIADEFIVIVIRRVLESARERAVSGKTPSSLSVIVTQVERELDSLLAPSLRFVINATGVLLHTGLGRAPISTAAAEAVQQASFSCNLEFDLESGERGDRQTHVERLLCLLTGAEAALVVNNNAAALYLTLNTIGYSKEVVVSRGQLIEIGGSFRLPEIMTRAGVRLVEVGTTNRTQASDYRAAITDRTALLLRAYPSNYRIDGFTESVPLDELVAVGKARSVPVVDDLGGGLLWDWTSLGLPHEPTVRESLAAGADLVLVSGDKVLGGPQAGIILGRMALVAKLKKAPLARVLRAEKLTIAGLSETLRAYLSPNGPQASLPVWQMLTCSLDSLRERATAIVATLKAATGWRVLEAADTESETGSGTLPAIGIPSIAVKCLPESLTAAKFAAALRTGNLPVVAKIRRDAVWLDLRTVLPSDDALLIEAVRMAAIEPCISDSPS